MSTVIQTDQNKTTIEYSLSSLFVFEDKGNITSIEYFSGVSGNTECFSVGENVGSLQQSTNKTTLVVDNSNNTDIAVSSFIGKTTLTPAASVTDVRQEVFIDTPALLPSYPAIIFEETTIDGEQVYTMKVNVP